MSVIEHVSSRSETVGGFGSNAGDAELVFHVTDTYSALAVRHLVALSSPLNYHQLVRQTMAIAPLGGGIWNVKVKYGKIDNKISMSIDTMCEKSKRMRSIGTVFNYQVRNTADEGIEGPDFGQLIGVSKDKVDGVEVYEKGSFKLNMQWSSKFNTISSDYIWTVMNMGATVNDAAVILSWKGQEFIFQKGELLFVGGTFGETADEGCNIALKFEGRINENDISIGDCDGVIQPLIEKEGHQYLWVRTVKVPDEGLGIEVEKPDSAHKENVYHYADFAQLQVFDTISSQDDDLEDQLSDEEEAEEEEYA